LQWDRSCLIDCFALVDLSRPAEVALNESIHSSIGGLGNDHPGGVLRNLGHHELESAVRLGLSVEDVIDPCENDRPNGAHLELASANQVRQVCGSACNRENWSPLHHPRCPAGAGNRKKLDSAESGELEHCFGESDRSLRVGGYDNQLDAPRNRVHTLQRRRDESGNGVHRLGQYMNNVLAAARRGLSLFRFQVCVLPERKMAQLWPRRYCYNPCVE
jgi:hypothetical protein